MLFNVDNCKTLQIGIRILSGLYTLYGMKGRHLEVSVTLASQIFLQRSAGLVVSGTVFANTIYLGEVNWASYGGSGRYTLFLLTMDLVRWGPVSLWNRSEQDKWTSTQL